MGLAAALVNALVNAEYVSISHFYLDQDIKSFDAQVSKFEKTADFNIKNIPIPEALFSAVIHQRSSDNNLPDMFTHWAGVHTQFLVGSNSLHPIDEMWDANGLDSVIAKSVARGAASYNGKRYLLPLRYDYAGLFYNKKVFADAGVTSTPKTWDEFLDLCEKLKSMGVTPIALGSLSPGAAQFWFDYMLLRTAGPDYRAKLMAGDVSYADSEVSDAMKMWKELIDKGYFVPNPNTNTLKDAVDQVAGGEAAMTLMLTAITSYWNDKGLVPGQDYDFFEFPVIKSGVPNAVVGLIDGLVISANVENAKRAEEFLAFMASADAQENWTKGLKSLAANVNVDPSNYNEVTQRAVATVTAADTFALYYNLSTPTPVVNVGRLMLLRFLEDPSAVDTILTQTADEVDAAFEETRTISKQLRSKLNH